MGLGQRVNIWVMRVTEDYIAASNGIANFLSDFSKIAVVIESINAGSAYVQKCEDCQNR
jgi:hypothetical protein